MPGPSAGRHTLTRNEARRRPALTTPQGPGLRNLDLVELYDCFARRGRRH